MSDHTPAVAGTRAHTLTPALAATSFPHRNPVTYPWVAVYQPSHLLRGLSRSDYGVSSSPSEPAELHA